MSDRPTAGDVFRAAEVALEARGTEYFEDRVNDILALVEKINEPEPEPVCSWCGMTNSEHEDTFGWPLTDMKVIVADGEEGYGEVLMFACADHLAEKCDELNAIGFADHRHGGANHLAPRDCPGEKKMEDCVIPGSRWDHDEYIQTPVPRIIPTPAKGRRWV